MLELGCGFFALPARVAARCGAAPCCASDGAGKAVAAVRAQLLGQPEEALVEATTLDWDSGGTPCAWDVIVFGDVIYSDEKAAELARCCARLLRGRWDQAAAAAPCVVGVVSTGRAGVAEFLAAMRREGFIAQVLPVSAEVQRGADSLWGAACPASLLCGGAAGAGFHLVRWARSAAGEEDREGLELERRLRAWRAERRPCSHPVRPPHLSAGAAGAAADEQPRC